MFAGVIGLGQIGGGVAVNLAQAGHLKAVFDVRSEVAEVLGLPASAASAAALATECDVIFIAVVDAAQIRSVLEGPDGVMASARPGTIVVILSTISLADLESIRKQLSAKGIVLVDCGVTGGPDGARRGQLVSLVGADADAFATVEPLISAFSCHVAHLGGSGSGMAAKIARNVMVYGAWRLGFEAMELARKAGVDPHKLAEAIEASPDLTNAGPNAWLLREPRADDPNEAQLRGAIRALAEKDLTAALDLAGELGVRLPIAAKAKRSLPQIMYLDEPEENEGGGEAGDDAFAKGLAMLDAVYGPGQSAQMEELRDDPYVTNTVTNLFASIWSRPNMSIRDRRLLVIGATAMLGRPDLIETQVRGAIVNAELNPEQLLEIPLHLAYYVGWGNSSALFRGIKAAIASVKKTEEAGE